MKNNIIEKEFHCVRNNLVIRGKEYCPQGNKLPAIIASHGFGVNSRHFTELCKTFASWGYAAFAYDFCGGSANGEGQSDGSSLDMTIDTECSDLIEVVNYVRSLPYIDKERVTLIGDSQGGLISALTAVREQKNVKFENLILMYPAFCIPEDARAGALASSLYNVNDVPDIIDCGIMQISRKFHESVVHMDVFQEIAHYRGRVLILHGLSDNLIDYKYSVQAAETYGSNQCHLQLIRDAGHGFTPEQNTSVLVSIHQFLQRKKEILTIKVIITGSESKEREGGGHYIKIFFTGSSESKYFKGTILPGAEDAQEHDGEKVIKVRADYTLEGKDCAGSSCHIHIVNQNVNGEWKPVVETNSKVLDFLNQADLTAAVEGFDGGLTVRIFSDQYDDHICE